MGQFHEVKGNSGSSNKSTLVFGKKCPRVEETLLWKDSLLSTRAIDFFKGMGNGKQIRMWVAMKNIPLVHGMLISLFSGRQKSFRDRLKNETRKSGSPRRTRSAEIRYNEIIFQRAIGSETGTREKRSSWAGHVTHTFQLPRDLTSRDIARLASRFICHANRSL